MQASRGAEKSGPCPGRDYHLPEEEPHSVQAAIPQAVEEFVREFYELLYRNIYVENANGQGYSPDPALRQEKLDGIQACYEYKFSNISDRYFKSRPWPHPDQISPHAYDDVGPAKPNP